MVEFPTSLELMDTSERQPFCRWCGEKLNDKRKRYCCREHQEWWVKEIRLSDCFWHTRELALQRDNHMCKGCGMTEEEHRKQYPNAQRFYRGYGLHVHHIVPKSEGGSNRLENLVSLCWDCHKEAHKELNVAIGQ